MNHRVILIEEVIANNHIQGCAKLIGERLNLCIEDGRRHVLRRCVHQVAQKLNTPCHGLSFHALGLIRNDELRHVTRPRFVF